MGSAQLSMNDIINGKHSKPFWINFYGTVGTFNKEMCRLMNEHSKLASEWMGRI